MSAAVYDDRTPLVIGACLFALAMRPVGYTGTAITLAAGVAGAAVATETAGRARRTTWALVTIAGIAVFAFARIAEHAIPVRLTLFGVAASVLAAVAEELFFRRLVYARLQRWGPAAAVAGAAAAFALVHVPSYGLLAAPVDFAAGLVLGWQRWASGSWTAPAATHVFANLVQVV